MRKIKIFSLVLAMMLLVGQAALAAPTTGDMQIFITATCYDYNHVGNDWVEYYELNGYQLLDGDMITLTRGDKLNLYSQITETDILSDDVGWTEDDYDVTAKMIREGFTIDQYLTVEEDSGIYSGYWCEWYITFEFVPVA